MAYHPKFSDFANGDVKLDDEKVKLKVFPVDRCGIDFLWYRHYRTHVLLRKSSVRNLKRRIHNLEKDHNLMQAESVISSIMSSLGWLMHCNSHNLSQKFIFGNNCINTIMKNAAEQLNIKNPLLGVSW